MQQFVRQNRSDLGTGFTKQGQVQMNIVDNAADPTASDLVDPAPVVGCVPASGSTFPADATYAVGDSPSSVAIGDLDGSGDLDLAVANAVSGNVSVLLNNGDGTFAPDVIYGAGTVADVFGRTIPRAVTESLRDTPPTPEGGQG